MFNPNQTPNYDAYEAKPQTHMEVMAVLHRIGSKAVDLVKLKNDLEEQGNSEELSCLLADEPEAGYMYI